MPPARHTLSRPLLAVAMLAALAACTQSAPPATSKGEDKPTAATAASEDAIAAAAAANAAPTTSPIAANAPTPPEVRPVVADPAAKVDVIAAMDKFKALRRYRMTMMRGDGQSTPTTTTVDYVAPDRYRVAGTGIPGQVAIGNTLYITEASGTRTSPAPADSLAQ